MRNVNVVPSNPISGMDSSMPSPVGFQSLAGELSTLNAMLAQGVNDMKSLLGEGTPATGAPTPIPAGVLNEIAATVRHLRENMEDFRNLVHRFVEG